MSDWTTYVALFPTPPLQRALALPKGVPSADIHLTLAFLGPGLPRAQLDYLALSLGPFAASAPPLSGHIADGGNFAPSRNHDVLWRSVEMEGLSPLREALVQRLAMAGFPAADLPFMPHLTLAYFSPGTRFQFAAPPLAWTPDAVTLVSGRRVTSFPFPSSHPAGNRV